jgi:hypothetical protein
MSRRHRRFASEAVIANISWRYQSGVGKGVMLFEKGELLFLWKAFLHVGVSRFGYGRLTFGTTGASLFTLVYVGVKAGRFSVSFVHFLVLLPL